MLLSRLPPKTLEISRLFKIPRRRMLMILLLLQSKPILTKMILLNLQKPRSEIQIALLPSTHWQNEMIFIKEVTLDEDRIMV